MASRKKKKVNKWLPYLGVGLGIVVIAAIMTAIQSPQIIDSEAKGKAKCQPKYNPQISPSEFSTNINNQYCDLPIGRRLVYEGETDEGREKVEIFINGETKEVMGVTTLVYQDKEWLDIDDDGVFSENELVEDTRDYLAQHSPTGDVWYFGEDVDNYEDGTLVDHEGSWLASVDGAKPGIWVKQNPLGGEEYLQECYRKVAEDAVRVVSLNETVETQEFGLLENCLRTYDYTRLDSKSREYKYYCPSIRALVMEEDVLTGEKVELVLSEEIQQSPPIF